MKTKTTKRTWLSGMALVVMPVVAMGQTTEKLVSDGRTPEKRGHPQHGIRPEELQSARRDQHVHGATAGTHLEHQPHERLW